VLHCRLFQRFSLNFPLLVPVQLRGKFRQQMELLVPLELVGLFAATSPPRVQQEVHASVVQGAPAPREVLIVFQVDNAQDAEEEWCTGQGLQPFTAIQQGDEAIRLRSLTEPVPGKLRDLLVIQFQDAELCEIFQLASVSRISRRHHDLAVLVLLGESLYSR